MKFAKANGGGNYFQIQLLHVMHVYVFQKRIKLLDVFGLLEQPDIRK